MCKLIGILGLVLTLATMIVAPVQQAYAAVAAATAPVISNDRVGITQCGRDPGVATGGAATAGHHQQQRASAFKFIDNFGTVGVQACDFHGMCAE